jgi:hypothetical protein
LSYRVKFGCVLLVVSLAVVVFISARLVYTHSSISSFLSKKKRKFFSFEKKGANRKFVFQPTCSKCNPRYGRDTHGTTHTHMEKKEPLEAEAEMCVFSF